MLNGLDLFSGIGGNSIALGEWVNTVTYCERDRYAQSVLLSRMREGVLSVAPIWDDVQTLRGITLPPIDIIVGGFPCQDISNAGDGAGLEGERSGLFFEIVRLARELRPRFVFLENVPAIAVRGLDRVLLELASLGFDCRWTIVSAGEVGASHLRERWFLLAHASSESLRISESGKRGEAVHASGTLEARAHPDAAGERSKTSRTRVGDEAEQPFGLGLLEGDDWDDYAAFFLGMDNGVPLRTHRLRCLGNAVVPLQARAAFERLIGFK